MRPCNRQRGATLVVSLIMLVVVTLLVVYAIRSGNTNLRIAGNMQTQQEAAAATHEVIEKVIEQIKTTDDLAGIAVQTATLPTGGVAQSAALTCVLETPVLNQDLNPAVPEDIPCFVSPDADLPIKADGTLSSKLSSCKQQNWEIQASVNDPNTGALLTQVQGISIRVPSSVVCP